jgi:4-hydroxyphenylpyruvate dioxygenase
LRPIAKHRHKNVTLYRQGEINFIVNAEPDSFAQRFARLHGPSDLRHRVPRDRTPRPPTSAPGLGAWGYAGQAGPGELNIPAIKGIGDSLIYLSTAGAARTARKTATSATSASSTSTSSRCRACGRRLQPRASGLTYIDHLTHNVHRGRMGEWAGFYERLFNFREVRYFDIEGQVTGVKSKAMTSPCGKIRIPINEEGNDKPGPDPGVPGQLPRRRHPAHRAGLDRSLPHRGRLRERA